LTIIKAAFQHKSLVHFKTKNISIQMIEYIRIYCMPGWSKRWWF